MNTTHLDSTNFDTTVSGTNQPVLVDFYAEWCGPCKMLSPIIDEVATEQIGKSVVAKLNIEDAGDIASRYGVTSIPALIVFKDGKPVANASGLQSKDAINKLIESAA